MCDASGDALGLVFGKKGIKSFTPFNMNIRPRMKLKKNNTVSKQKLLVVVFAFKIIHSYLLGTWSYYIQTTFL